MPPRREPLRPPADVAALVARHWPLLRRVCLCYAGRLGLDCDDATSAAALGLWRAAELFDPARGYAFSSVAWLAMVRKLKNAAGVRRRRLATTNLTGDGADDGWNDQADDRAEQPLDVLLEDEARSADVRRVRSGLARLRGRDRRILLERAEGRTRLQIGADLGISESRVGQLEERAMMRLRRELLAAGVGSAQGERLRVRAGS